MQSNVWHVHVRTHTVCAQDTHSYKRLRNPSIHHQETARNYCTSVLTPNQRINSNIISMYKSNHSAMSENSSQTIKVSVWKAPAVSPNGPLPRVFLTVRLNQCERRTRGLDLPPSGLAWPSTTTSLSGCIRFIEAMSPLPQAWDLINVTQLPSKIIMGIMQKSTFCLRVTTWTGRKKYIQR